jgi:hypothetical protein
MPEQAAILTGGAENGGGYADLCMWIANAPYAI